MALNIPTKEQIKRFLEVFDKLAAFEGMQRNVRNQGCFNEKDLPIPEVVVVYKWLEKKKEKL